MKVNAVCVKNKDGYILILIIILGHLDVQTTIAYAVMIPLFKFFTDTFCVRRFLFFRNTITAILMNSVKYLL